MNTRLPGNGCRKRLRNESGATAILVAIMAAMLLSVAGVAVDLGNAWARGRSVQKQADVSAIGAGYLLPMDSGKAGHTKADIAAEVATRLNENPATGQRTVTGAMLINSSMADGDIVFEQSGGGACANACPRMTVRPPEAQVDFGFATVMGFSNTQVQRPATVEVQSELPRKQDMLPFWLPSGCGYGPTQADTTGGTHGGPVAPAAWVMPRAAAVLELASSAVVAAAPTPTPTGTHILSGNPVNTVTAGSSTTLNGYSVYGVASQYKKVSLRAFSPDGGFYIDFSAQTTGDGALPSLTVGPADVTGTVGDWYLFALAAKSNGDTGYSANYLVIRVTGTAPTPTATPTPTPSDTASPSTSASPSATVTGVSSGCVGQDRGNFGQLDSPRADESNSQKAFALNIADGIDHQLMTYVFPSTVSETKDCGSGSSLLVGAKLDNQGGATGNGANCMKGDTGNDGPKTYDGLIAGVDSSHPGRLNASRGTTTCPSRTNRTVSGTEINNDTLSCFLRNGATLSQIAADSGVNENMLDPAIKLSPRFVYMPVVFPNDRAQKGFQPIRQFVPGFITEETQSAGPADDSGHVNGLDINGNSVQVLHVFTFNRDALSPDEVSDTTVFDPAAGGAIVRLVG